MALIPLIQPPIMRLLTTDRQRKIKMVQTRRVSKTERIIFPVMVTIFVALLLPDTAPLVGSLMLGNLLRETGCTDRLSDTVQNAMMNIITVLLSTSVGATMVGSNFLTAQTLKIVVLGVVAFGISTAGGLLGGQVMRILTRDQVNPPDWLRRRIRCPNGCPGIQQRGPAGQSLQFPSDACNGSECSRCDRLRRCGRDPASLIPISGKKRLHSRIQEAAVSFYHKGITLFPALLVFP